MNKVEKMLIEKYKTLEGMLNGDRLDGYYALLSVEGNKLVIKIPFDDNDYAKEELFLCSHRILPIPKNLKEE